MPSDDLFASSTPAMDEAAGGAAWVSAFAAVERALADAEERVGVIPAGSAAAIARAAAEVEATIAPSALRDDGAFAGTPVVPFVRALRDAAGEAGQWVHHGSTSQDVIDTALAIVARRAGAVLGAQLTTVEDRLGALAREHRDTVMAARTLMQEAEPTTFGLKAAGWLHGMLDAHRLVARAVAALPAQLGGAVGTLSELGEHGTEVVERFARALDLPAPQLPWHTQRAPVANLAAALGIAAGAISKVAGDVVLLAQTEVGEVAERPEPGRGVSSAMPHKRNPVASIAAVAAARRAAPLAQALVTALDHEHERAAGAWQAEAPMVCDLFRLTALAADRLADALDGLEVDAGRMRTNLERLGPAAVKAALEPGGLGSAGVFVDRALAALAASRREQAGA